MVERMLGLAPGSVRTIYNGVPDVDVPTVDRPGTGPVIGTIGRLSPEKGLDVVLRALTELPDVTALIVGEGPERDAARAARAGARGRRARDLHRAGPREPGVLPRARRLRARESLRRTPARGRRGDAREPPGRRHGRRQRLGGDRRRRDRPARASGRPVRARAGRARAARRPCSGGVVGSGGTGSRGRELHAHRRWRTATRSCTRRCGAAALRRLEQRRADRLDVLPGEARVQGQRQRSVGDRLRRRQAALGGVVAEAVDRRIVDARLDALGA